MKQKNRARSGILGRIGILLFSLLVLAHAARGDVVVIEHTGAADPKTEGFTSGYGNNGLNQGPIPANNITPYGTAVPIVGDLARSAWQVNDTSSGGGLGYIYALSVPQLNDANTLGWTMSTTLRAINQPSGTNGAVFVNFQTTTTRWSLWFDEDGSGHTRAHLESPAATPFFIAADGDYHEYTLRYNAASGKADVLVDNNTLVSNYGGAGIGAALFNNSAYFGSGSTALVGSANFNHFVFSTNTASVPEPGSLVLGAIGALGMVGAARRKGKKS